MVGLQKRQNGSKSVELRFTDGSMHSHRGNRPRKFIVEHVTANLTQHALKTLGSHPPDQTTAMQLVSNVQKNATYQKQLAGAKASGKTLIYLDETGFADETFRSHGYALRGQCVHGLIPSQKNRTTTLILNNKLIAPKFYCTTPI